MSLQTALVAIKTANTTLNTLIGTRFHPDKLPQEVVMPCVRFEEISRNELDWTFARRPQLVRIRVQLDGYAESSALRTTLRAAVMGCFLPATRISGTYGGETVLDIRTEGGLSEVEMLDTETEAYRFTRDLIIEFRFSESL